MNAILYVDRTGVRWRYLPHHFPHWNTVYGYFAKWRQEGVFAQLDGLIRRLLRPMGGAVKESFREGRPGGAEPRRGGRSVGEREACHGRVPSVDRGGHAALRRGGAAWFGR